MTSLKLQLQPQLPPHCRAALWVITSPYHLFGHRQEVALGQQNPSTIQ